MWQYCLLPVTECAVEMWSERTDLYMNDLPQLGWGQGKGRSGEDVLVEEGLGRRCFLEMWPVRAASEANDAVQLDQAQVVVPFVWTDLRCFLRSVVLAKVAEQVEPQGMSHWQVRDGEVVASVDVG